MNATRIMTLVTLAAAPFAGFTEEAKGTAAEFLKILPGARGMGMGGAFTALAGDPSAALVNPAGLATLHGGELMLMHLDHWMGMTYDFASLTAELERSVRWGMSGILFQSGSIPRTVEDRWGGYDALRSTGSFSASDLALGGSIAVQLAPAVSVGVTAYLIDQEMDRAHQSGLAATFGLLARLDAQGTSLGVVLQHAGLDLNGHPLPTTMMVGLVLPVVGGTAVNMVVSVEGQLPLAAHASPSVHTGAELTVASALALRAGYQLSGAREAVSAGVGAALNLGMVKSLDYAMSPSEAFGVSHRFSVTLRWE